MTLPEAFGGAKVMITGGLGFIGSALARRLVGLGAEVLLVDSLIPEHGGTLENLRGCEGSVRIDISDIRDSRSLGLLLRGQRYLFNLAGQTSHLDSMADPETDLAINCASQLSLLETCRAVNPGVTVVYASTRQIYGRPSVLPVDEGHPLRPVDINGINKMAGEAYHLLYHQVYGIPCAALRLTNTYGPRMRIKDARQTFVGVWIRRLLEGQPFEVWGGGQLRDFTFVEDLVEALLLAAATPAVHGKALNIGGTAPVSLRALAETLIAANGGKGRYEIREFPEERRRIDIGDYFADDRAFRGLTGWRVETGLEEGLRQTLDFFRERLQYYL